MPAVPSLQVPSLSGASRAVLRGAMWVAGSAALATSLIGCGNQELLSNPDLTIRRETITYNAAEDKDRYQSTSSRGANTVRSNIDGGQVGQRQGEFADPTLTGRSISLGTEIATLDGRDDGQQENLSVIGVRGGSTLDVIERETQRGLGDRVTGSHDSNSEIQLDGRLLGSQTEREQSFSSEVETYYDGKGAQIGQVKEEGYLSGESVRKGTSLNLINPRDGSRLILESKVTRSVFEEPGSRVSINGQHAYDVVFERGKNWLPGFRIVSPQGEALASITPAGDLFAYESAYDVTVRGQKVGTLFLNEEIHQKTKTEGFGEDAKEVVESTTTTRTLDVQLAGNTTQEKERNLDLINKVFALIPDQNNLNVHLESMEEMLDMGLVARELNRPGGPDVKRMTALGLDLSTEEGVGVVHDAVAEIIQGKALP
jgi:hypothetical protein